MIQSETFAEIKNLLKSIVKWAIVLLVLSFYFFIFPLSKPFTVQFFEMMKSDIVPRGVDLIVSSPFTAFLVEIKISVFLSLIFSFPLLLWSMLRYVSPALKKTEKMVLYKVVVPSTLLFFAGCIFAYRFIIPATIKILYSYTPDIGATALFNVDDFISLSFVFMALTGFMFLLPIGMIICSFVGIIPFEFWRDHWRHALAIAVVASAVVTPDGTGITMILLLIPLSLLYIGGLMFSFRYRVKKIASN